MEISYNTMLNKMEEKIREAKVTDSSAKLREYAQAIKTLCEVILDDKNDSVSQNTYTPSASTQRMIVHSSPTVNTQVPTTISAQQKLETDDGANGDSIFDF